MIERLISSDEWGAKEIDIFKAILQWGHYQAQHSEQSYEEFVKPLLPHIRFPLFKINQLAEVAATNLLPPEHILALYVYVAKSKHDPAKVLPSELPYSSATRGGKTEFEFESMWDMKGLLS